MKNILILGSLMLSSALFAQNEGKQLTPKWKTGVVTEYRGTYDYRGHDFNVDDVRTHFGFNLNFEVVQDDKEQYIIRSLVPNLVLFQALDLSNNGRADFTPFEEVNIFYSYNKTTGVTELLNWESLIQIYSEAKSEMTKHVSYYPQKQMKFDSMIQDLDLKFKDSNGVKSAYQDQMNWFTSYFGKNFVLDKTFTSNSTLINPFFNDDHLKVSSKNTVNQIDKESTSFTYTKDFTIKDSYYKNSVELNLKNKQNKKQISEKEKTQLQNLRLTTFTPKFLENHTINYETTLPVSFKIEYILDEKKGHSVQAFKKVITLNKKK